ncbi:MAG: hypothetical protein SGPRY_012770, partial [Prymnesium sp.]
MQLSGAPSAWGAVVATAAALLLSGAAPPAMAAKDCFVDCNSNCNRVAPRSV